MFHFISDNFELFGRIFLVVVGLSVLFYVLFRIIESRNSSSFSSSIERAVSVILITMLFFLSASMAMTYWLNYKTAASIIDVDLSVYKPLDWAAGNKSIYFAENNKLSSVRLNGRNISTVLDAKEPIREFHFSPDGRYAAVVSYNSIYLADLRAGSNKLIDQVVSSKDESGLRGVIDGVMWSPQSDKFCYELSRWSQYGSQSRIHIYSVKGDEEKIVDNTAHRIPQLFWGRDGKILYYFNSRLKDASSPQKVYAVDVFKVSLDKLEPEADVSFVYQEDSPVYDPVVKPYVKEPSAPKARTSHSSSWVSSSKSKDTNSSGFVWINRLKEVEKETAPSLMTEGFKNELSFIPVDRLEIYGVNLYLDGIKSSFVRNQSYEDWISDKGSLIGIDDSDYLYFVKDKWFKKRMFKVEREYDPQINHQYAGGKLVVDQMRWLPGGKYVVMDHKDWGVLLLDPYQGKIGVLIRAQQPLVGWRPAQK